MERQDVIGRLRDMERLQQQAQVVQAQLQGIQAQLQQMLARLKRNLKEDRDLC